MNGPIICFGEALWDLLPDGAVLGGAPLNLTYRLQSAGFTSVIVSSLGEDEYGRMARGIMKEYGMDDRFVFAHRQRPTGTVEINFDSRGEPSYTIVKNVAYDDIPIRVELEEAARAAACFCYGTLAQRSPGSRETLTSLLKTREGKTNLLDINLRPDCYNREIVDESLRHATLLKLNEDESALLKNWYALPENDYRLLASALCRRFDLDCCILTLGPRGACAASGDGETCTEPTFDVPRVDPCGAGDAFTAGFLSIYLNGGTLPEACRLGNAMGSAVTSRRGALQEIPEGDIERILDKGIPYEFREEDFRIR